MQMHLLITICNLDDDEMRSLISFATKRKSSNWFHSEPEYIELNQIKDFLIELKSVFHHASSGSTRRKKCKDRRWRKKRMS